VAFEQVGQSEVRDARLAPGIQENIGGFDVSMRHATRVGVIDGGRDLLQNPNSVLRRQPSLAEKRGKTSSRREAHAHPGDSFIDSARENGNDGRIVEARDDLGFVFEPGGERGVVKELRRQYFERDGTIESRVVCLVYRGHSSLAEESNDRERAKRGADAQRRDVWFILSDVIVSEGTREKARRT
jgi:hypothetical protein